MNESKTAFSEGWLQTPREDNNGKKITHYFKEEKTLCDKYSNIPADVIVNPSASIQCEDCQKKLKESTKETNEKTEDVTTTQTDPEQNYEVPNADQDSEMKTDTAETESSQS